jgi:immune inhibitor A
MVRKLRLLSLTFLLAGCASAAAAVPASQQRAQERAQQRAQHRLVAAAQLMARQVNQPVPGRDLYQLAEDLKLRPQRPIARVIRTKSPNYPVGHTDKFWVLSEDQNRYFLMTASIRAETAHLYLYVQDGLKYPTADVQRAAQHFEQHTYGTDRKYFGSEWTPGIDGDPHVVCLLGDLRSSNPAGFFSSEDEYPRAVNLWSNQREMFYINSANTSPGGSDFDLTLSHEFQHMIHWHMHPHENLWINEGMSMLAEELNGYSAQAEAQSFLGQPRTQLNGWNATNDFPNYGAAYLFLTYLHERYGTAIVRAILADSSLTDIPLIDYALRKVHAGLTARQVFEQWVLANYIHDKSVPGGVYDYKQLHSQVSVTKSTSVPFSFQGNLPPYAADYVEMTNLEGQKPFRLQFSAPRTVPVVGVSRTPPFWWSNRGDMMTTSLQRTVDLTHAQHPTLRFQGWWDIEKDYDYVYVEASKDGGKTYATLRGTDTTATNPNGANYGNGYTGNSKGWHDESVDLSGFAGKRITLRFQYVTDDGVNGESMVMRNLAVPEIGWRDNFTGWTHHGFLPITTNALPSTWTVDLISYTTHGTTVSRLPLSSIEQGSLLIDPSKTGLKKMVAVVFTTAPKTTVVGGYQLSAVSSQ